MFNQVLRPLSVILVFLKGGEFFKDFKYRIKVRCGVLIGLMKKRF